MTDISTTPIPADLDTNGMNLDDLLKLAYEEGYSMDELAKRSGLGVGRQLPCDVEGHLA